MNECRVRALCQVTVAVLALCPAPLLAAPDGAAAMGEPAQEGAAPEIAPEEAAPEIAPDEQPSPVASEPATVDEPGTTALDEGRPEDNALPVASGPPMAPKHRITYLNATFVRINPIGLENRFRVMYQRRLWGRSGKLFDNTYVGIGPRLDVAPSNTRVGGLIEVVPLAILQLRASYYMLAYFGSQKYKAHPFESPNDEFGPDQIAERVANNQAINTYGGQAELSALLQLKFGPIAVRNEFTGLNFQVNLPDPSDVYYDIRTDMLVPGRGWVISNESDLLYVNDKIRLTAGVRATYLRAFYPPEVFGDADPEVKGQNDHFRVGPLVTYRFKDRPEKRFVRPTLFVAAQWWVKHRYRAGQQVSQAMPLMVLGFLFSGDFWPKPR